MFLNFFYCLEYVRKYASEEALLSLSQKFNLSHNNIDKGNESDSTISDFYEGNF